MGKRRLSTGKTPIIDVNMGHKINTWVILITVDISKPGAINNSRLLIWYFSALSEEL